MESDLSRRIKSYLSENKVELTESIGSVELWRCLPLVKEVFGSYRNFCHYYDLNASNFANWTKNKRSYSKARTAMISFLSNPPTAAEIDSAIHDRFIARFDTHRRPQEVLESKKSKECFDNYEVCCFIDGDNNMHAIYSLLDIPIDTTRVKCFSFHALSFKNTKTKAELERLAPALDIEYDSSSKGKDIADYMLCIRVFMVLKSKTSKFESNPSSMPQTRIYLISADKFIDTVARRLKVEFSEYLNSIQIYCWNAEKTESLGWHLYEHGYSKPNYDIKNSQFYSAWQKIQAQNIADLVQSLNKHWDEIEMRNQQYNVLPFTADNIIHYLKSHNKINAITKPSVQAHASELSAIKLVKSMLKNEGRATILIKELEQELDFPAALKDQFGSWSKFFEKTAALCSEYGLTVNDKKITLEKFSAISMFSEGKELDRIAPEKLRYEKQAQQMRTMIAEIGLSDFLKLTKQLQLEVNDKARNPSNQDDIPVNPESSEQSDSEDDSVTNVTNEINKMHLR